MRKCTKCNVEKEDTEFKKETSKWCKECVSVVFPKVPVIPEVPIEVIALDVPVTQELLSVTQEEVEQICSDLDVGKKMTFREAFDVVFARAEEASKDGSLDYKLHCLYKQIRNSMQKLKIRLNELEK